MVAYNDKLVGQVRQKLLELGIDDSTLLIYTSDNGTDREIRSRQNGVEVQGGKGRTVHSGTHVPFVAWWPGNIAAGRVQDDLIQFTDFLPTFAALAGAQLPTQIDGENLLPTLLRGAALARDHVFVHYEPHWAKFRPTRYVFDTRWKLYHDGRFFDLGHDLQEEEPLEIAKLSGDDFAAYERLRARLQSKEGTLSSAYLPGGEIVLISVVSSIGALLVLGIGWHLHRARRSRQG